MKNLNKRGNNIDLWGTHRIISSHSLMIIHFFAKLSWKAKFFLKKYTLFAEKNVLIWRKKFYIKNFFYWKKTFFTEKNINENVKNI